MSTEALPGLDHAAKASVAPAPATTRPPLRQIDVARFIQSRPLYYMLALLVLEALLSATTTYLVIQAGRAVAAGQFIVSDLVWIFVAQSASYASGAVSWVFAEQAGYRAFGRYMLEDTRSSRYGTRHPYVRSMPNDVRPLLSCDTSYSPSHRPYAIAGTGAVRPRPTSTATMRPTETVPKIS